MPRLIYKSKKFRGETQNVIYVANGILRDYAAQGYDLTLRQLYYQFVARGHIANRQSEYNKLGNIVNDARLAGLIDWDHITDRTRNLRELPHWQDPADAIKDWVKRYFAIDLWADQPERIEVWIEKDALVGVIAGVCQGLGIPYFSCRGYTSQSEMWVASQRMLKHIDKGQSVRVLHLGDHDPSGIDMTRDIDERLFTFLAIDHWRNKMEGSSDKIADSIEYIREHFFVNRIALTMDQVEEHDPPPNPAKISDSRANAYIAEYGDESWELDALPPDYLSNLIQDSVEEHMDHEAYEAAKVQEAEYVKLLTKVSNRWDEVAELVR